MRHTAVIVVAAALGAIALAGCGGEGVTTPTPNTVVGTYTAPTTTFPVTPAFKLKGDAAKGKATFLANCGSCHTLAAANTTGTVGPNLDTLKPNYQAVTAQVTNGGAVMPARVAAFALDLDRTLIAEDGVLRPRTREALARTRATGTHVVVVTGRMFRAVRPYLEQAQLDDLVVCYQGAVIADPATGEFLLHVPIPLAAAREAMDAVLAAGFHLNCYLDDQLYVAEVTPEARRYADFQHLEIHAVSDLRAWLDRDPTKLVAVGDPRALDELEAELEPRFAGRLFISKSLPFFLEFAHPDVSKGSGLAFVADRLGFQPEETVACGDGENDRELLDWAGFGVAVANAHDDVLARADLVVPSVQDEGVAVLLEAYLDSVA